MLLTYAGLTNKARLMEFTLFSNQIKQQFTRMCEQPVLFRSNIPGSKIWEVYISSFVPGTDPVFRDPNSTEHTCNHDKNFIHRYGNVVAIIDGEIVTMFDTVESGTYYPSASNIKNLLKCSPIENVFVESYDTLNRLLNYESTNKIQAEYKLGFEKSHKIYTPEEANKFGVVTPGQVYTFYHFNASLPKKFVDFSSNSVESIQGNHRDAKKVFKRGLDEISLDTLILVRDLIQQGSLLNGDSYLDKLRAFILFAEDYKNVPSHQKDEWCWIKSYNLPFAKFRNELIGTLCVELTEGEDLNKAVLAWNKRVDPANFMKATTIYTPKQREDAINFIVENGYKESFDRRFAKLDDINVSEIFHQNVGTGAIKTASMFDKALPTVSTQHKRAQFDGIEEVTIEKFMKDILPTCTLIEAFLENRFDGNLVALHTANNPNSKKAFKWSNNFGWTYNGNLAGKSMIKEAVKTAGGNVTGVLRCSLMWNESGKDNSDLDLWCIQPNNEKIGFNTGFRKDSGGSFSSCSGQLDLDIRHPDGKIAVENIYFTNPNKMKDGKYKFYVHQYSSRNSQNFKAEIEFNGEIYNYHYPKAVSGSINIATVTLKDGQFSIEHHLPETASSKKLWNLDTNQFHKVNLVCLSPNFWGDNNTGNKHYMFMLDNCQSDIALRSFHTEFLNSDLLEHRKVMEVLGETTKLEPTANQLCGLGFNATVTDELILKLSGSYKRTIKIKF